MGSSASKATKASSKLPSAAASATNTARKYPTRTPPTSNSPNTSAKSRASQTAVKTEASAQFQGQGSEQSDGAPSCFPSGSEADPALNARLKTIGPVQPNPTHSHSSTFHSHSDDTSSFTDPTFAAQNFRPSASNPLQRIFPSSSNSSAGSPGKEGSSSNANSNSVSGEGNARSGSGMNPAVSLLTARYRLANDAENEFAQTGKSTAAAGRQFLDVLTLRQILVLRDEKGVKAGEIESVLGLRSGVVERLGRRGIVGVRS